MRIFTSYFAKVSDIPTNIVPISICGKAPIQYRGHEYKNLAPKYYTLKKWKETHDNEYFKKRFKEETLDKLNVSDVLADLEFISEGKDIALIGYERSGVCHRFEVANWFRSQGINVEEYDFRKQRLLEKEIDALPY